MIEEKESIEVRIRDLTPADYPRFCELRNHTMVEPARPDVMEARDRNLPEGEIKMRIAATRPTDADEEIVAVGMSNHWAGMCEGTFFLSVDVDPAFRRRGIGSAVFADLVARTIPVGGRKLISVAREDIPAGSGFLERQGFVYHQRLIDSQMDLAAYDDERFAELIQRLSVYGIRMASYAELGDTEQNRRRLHELHNECDAETPGIEDWGLTTFESFEAEVFRSPYTWLEGITLAIHGDEWIGLSMVYPSSGTAYGTGFTGVRKAWRGRGVGLAAKSVSLSAAKAAGGTVCRAQNDDRNKPMLAINDALGFKPQYGWIYVRKEIENGDE
jgi:GNAT superfamily N-acetyltransferase